MQKQLDTTYAHIDNSAASFFTKEDVKVLLRGFVIMLEDAQKAEQRSGEFTPDYVLEKLETLQQEVMDEIRSYDYSDAANIDLDGREIVVDFDSSYLEDRVDNVFHHFTMTLSSQKS